MIYYFYYKKFQWKSNYNTNNDIRDSNISFNGKDKIFNNILS